jgi:uncharacterized protein YjbJ (UPF0337 family)
MHANKDILEGKWKQLRGEVKQWWGDLTDDDVDRISGSWDKLSGALQERYGYTKEEASSSIADFLEQVEARIDTERS